jgi:hypothetical protein
MSEGKSNRKGSQAAPAAPALPYSGGEADAFVRDLLLRVSEEARKSRPTMGTVISAADGGLVVQIDNEKAPRTIALARALAVEYRQNDRVKCSLMRNDEYVVDGVYTDAGTDERIGPKQLQWNSVTTNAIAPGSVDWTALADPVKAVITRKIQAGDIAQGAINWGHLEKGESSNQKGWYLSNLINKLWTEAIERGWFN